MVVQILVASALLLCINASAYPDGSSIPEILRRIDELEERDRSQQAELEILRRQNLVMEDEIKQLKDQDSRQTRRIEVLEARELVTKDVIDGLMDGVQGPTEGDTESQSNNETQDFYRHSNEGLSKTSIGNNRIRQVEGEMPISFFATMTNHAQHLGVNQKIAFDNAITNNGNAYRTSVGIFIAPVSGVYVFSTTIMTMQESAHFQFVVNGKVMSSMNAYGTETFETTSMTAIFNLAKGDDVAIQNGDYNDKMVHGWHYSSFSGFLLSVNVNSQIIG